MTLAIKSLADGQLGIGIATLYTCITTGAIIKHISLVNTDTVARTVNLYVNPTGGGSRRRFIPKDMSLDPGSCLTWGASQEVLTLELNDIIEGDASAATVVDYVINGVERA